MTRTVRSTSRATGNRYYGSRRVEGQRCRRRASRRRQRVTTNMVVRNKWKSTTRSRCSVDHCGRPRLETLTDPPKKYTGSYTQTRSLNESHRSAKVQRAIRNTGSE